MDLAESGFWHFVGYWLEDRFKICTAAEVGSSLNENNKKRTWSKRKQDQVFLTEMPRNLQVAYQKELWSREMCRWQAGGVTMRICVSELPEGGMSMCNL